MKNLFLLFFLIHNINSNIYAQKDSEVGVTLIKIYTVEWNLKSKIAYTMDNFKGRYKYYFENNGLGLENMFVNYNDCIDKLNSQKIIPSDSASFTMIRNYVELKFEKKKSVNLYFDYQGNYYFENKWHSRNEGLYYSLFKYFSNTLVSETLIEQAKKKNNDSLWHSD
ncbi:MAG: hypothetical protein H0V01_04745 [Bacteroidetes bacterium]|nr:hypothetical protein [Bacteroidota bacterium]HET6243686.1 hypothetical protein [Bacteroidia bacterium]